MVMIPSGNDVELDELWQSCVDAFAQYNIVLKLPKHTDRHKTYQWRYLKKMNENFKKWRLSADEVRQFLAIAVQYARYNRIAFKGLSLFHQNNILQMCYDRLKEKKDKRQRIVKNLKSMKLWFDQQIDGKDPLAVCLHKTSKNAMCNLAKWYQASKINPLFMALTKPCMMVLDMVGDTDKSLLPSKAELVLARTDFLSLIK